MSDKAPRGKSKSLRGRTSHTSRNRIPLSTPSTPPTSVPSTQTIPLTRVPPTQIPSTNAPLTQSTPSTISPSTQSIPSNIAPSSQSSNVLNDGKFTLTLDGHGYALFFTSYLSTCKLVTFNCLHVMYVGSYLHIGLLMPSLISLEVILLNHGNHGRRYLRLKEI